VDFLIVELESLLYQRGKTSADIIRATGHTPAIRLKTLLDICLELDCQPGDLIKRVNECELEKLATQRAKDAVNQVISGKGSTITRPTRVHVVDLNDE